MQLAQDISPAYFLYKIRMSTSRKQRILQGKFPL